MPEENRPEAVGEAIPVARRTEVRTGKAVIYGLFAGAARRLRPGGEMYVVIRKQQGAESAQRYLETVFGRVERIARDKGYWVLRCAQPEEEK